MNELNKTAEQIRGMPASELKSIAFPLCAPRCSALDHLGAGECDSICPFKFRAVTGKPYMFETLSQSELDQLSASHPTGIAGEVKGEAGNVPLKGAENE